MTQNEIIIRLIQRAQKARKDYEENKTESNLARWDRHIAAIEVLADIFQEAEDTKAMHFLNNPPFRPAEIVGSVKPWDKVN